MTSPISTILYTVSAFLAMAGCGHPILATLLLPGAVLGVVVGCWWEGR